MPQNPQVSSELLKRRYSMFGGNPCSVLEFAGDRAYEDELRATIETTDIDKPLKVIGNTRASVTADSSLVFYYQPGAMPDLHPEPMFQSGRWVWCSRWYLQNATNVLVMFQRRFAMFGADPRSVLEMAVDLDYEEAPAGQELNHLTSLKQ
jgi:hypothetical protein